jgi:RNA polymerase primary sigma factor
MNYENESLEKLVNRKLSNLEQHVINLIIPIQNLQRVLSSTDYIKNLESFQNKPINIDDRKLRELLNEFDKKIKSYETFVENLSSKQTISEIKYIGKRLLEIQQKLEIIEKEGFRKEIKLNFECDGYELVKKSKYFDKNEEKEIPNGENHVLNLLNTLSDREKFVIIHRLGLLGEKGKTYKDIGKLIGVSGDRVRQIFIKGIRKCGHPNRRMLLNKKENFVIKEAIRQHFPKFLEK